jgi:hypothetical protein
MMAKNMRIRSEDPDRQRPALEKMRGGERLIRPGAGVGDARQ